MSSIRLLTTLLLLFHALAARAAVDDLAQRCGTHIGTGEGAVSQAPAARPAPGTFQIGTTHVIVHYEDAGLADYAQDVSDAAELTYRTLIDTLLYLVPPSDAPAGGDGRVDVYLQTPAQIGDVWGATFVETLVGSPYVGSSTSYVTVVDTMSLARRLAVTAHEMFHVVQIGYDPQENRSFLEMISMWIEDRVYDDADVYLEVLPYFFEAPDKGLYTHTYSNVPWAIYLAENYGDGIVRDILENCTDVSGSNVVGAIDESLSAFGTSHYDEYLTFMLWNYFTNTTTST
jgi:hypothetical protein